MGKDIALSNNKEDEKYMKISIEQAKIADENGDVPIAW